MLNQIKKVFEEKADNLAFQIGSRKYTYSDWLSYINGIREILRKEKPENHFIGLATQDDIETYASIIALWAEGYAFVPLSRLNPIERNDNSLRQTETTVVLNSQPDKQFYSSEFKTYKTSGLQVEGIAPDLSSLDPDSILSMLFTSGSTGQPKGVPYTAKNINTTLDAFWALDYDLTEQDRFLQMFELTFDMSMLSYLPAWCIGASVHIVESEGLKYLNAFKVMKEQEVTFAAMVPSTLQLLRPYFSQINLPRLRYSLLGGEPFYIDLAKSWMDCIPNAQLVNISGPCETTMACMGYNLNRDFSKNKSHKNILAFGSPWKNTSVLLLNEQDESVKIGEVGELCFGGDHVMEGYWKLPEKNKTIFFEREIESETIRFYRSGDMAFQDESGIYYSTGRKDIQYKIQGFKVELGDVEQHARDFIKKGNAAALVDQNENGLLEIHLFIDQSDVAIKALSNYLEEKLPAYMQPRNIRKLKKFPLTSSGKLSRPELQKIFEGDDFEFVVESEMAKRISQNLFESYRRMADCLKLPIWKNESLEAIDPNLADWPRTIFGQASPGQITSITKLIHQKKLPSRIVLLRPDQPKELYQNIDASGFRHMVSWPGMALDLLNNEFQKSENEIRLIKSEAELKQWQTIVNEALFKKINLDPDIIKSLWDSGTFDFYGLWFSGEIVSTAMTFSWKEGLGVFMVATAENHQRKGFAKDIMLYLLQSGKSQGCHAAYLESSISGEALYRKLGFQQFCTFDIFWLLEA